MAFHPEDRVVASCSKDESIKLWNLDDGGLISTMNVDGSVSSIDFAPCGNKFAAALNIYSWSGAHGDFKEGGVKIFSNQGSAGFVCQSTLSCDSQVVNSVIWSPDGAKIVAGSGSFGEGKVWIFD